MPPRDFSDAHLQLAATATVVVTASAASAIAIAVAEDSQDSENEYNPHYPIAVKVKATHRKYLHSLF